MGIDDTYMNDDEKDEKTRLIHQGKRLSFGFLKMQYLRFAGGRGTKTTIYARGCLLSEMSRHSITPPLHHPLKIFMN